ncbi:Tyrosinase [Orbilia brochopaga]|nr:Tyrosinase [Drechslerella brochopaga]
MVRISPLVSAAAAVATFGRVSASPVNFGLQGLEGGVKGELAKRTVLLSTLTNNSIQPVQNGQQAPMRKEIRQLQREDPEGFNLYILALASLMAKPQSDITSYFQISGIHGRPFITWDGVTGGNDNGGYCTHADILFLTWHRPYVALYEAALYAEVQQIASKFPEGSRDRAAALNWRIPYWDWLSNNFAVPDVVGTPQIQVRDPTRGTVDIANPLYSYQYKFGNGEQQQQFPDPPFNTVRQTSRQPIGTLNRQFANIGTNLKNRVYNLLTTYNDFSSFSNKGTSQAVDGRLDSLESVHDVIHATVGGNTGEMAYVDYAAMDNMFWLHHTNIDRLFAIWQGMRNNTQGSFLSTSFVNQFGTYAIPANTREDSRTPLAPFHKSNTRGDYYTSDDIRSTKALGYVYPETDDTKISPEQFSAWVISQVNAIYGAGSPAGVLTSVSSVTASMSSTTPAASPTTPVNNNRTPTTLSRAPTSSVNVPPVNVEPPVRGVEPTPSRPSATATPNRPDTNTPNRPPQNGNGNRESCQSIPWYRWIFVGRTDCWRDWWERRTGDNDNDNHRRFELPNIPDTIQDATDIVSDTVDTIGNIIDKAIDSLPSVGDLVKHAASLINGGDQYIEYIAQVKTENSALKGTYTVYLFLGDYDATKPATWATERNLVGTHSAFSNLGGGHQYTGSGAVPLTLAVMNQIVAGKVQNLGREAVVPFLQKNLRWEVATAGGEAVPSKDVQGLKVSIASSDVKLPCVEGALPIWGKAKTEYGVTEGKDGGLCAGETMV